MQLVRHSYLSRVNTLHLHTNIIKHKQTDTIYPVCSVKQTEFCECSVLKREKCENNTLWYCGVLKCGEAHHV